jgi:GTP-binding protein
MKKVCIIGRANVGKSTLVNRILGKRKAVVQNSPGVTRDRIVYKTNWGGLDFEIVDTGGWDSKSSGLELSISEQTEIAIGEADLLILVIDGQTGITSTEQLMLKILRKSNKKIILAINKIDAEKESEISQYYSLGLGEPFAISALHGKGIGELLDQTIIDLKLNKAAEQKTENIPNISLIGKPNSGKSSLLNSLLGHNRATVSHIAGTTRDPIDEVVQIDNKKYNLIDTAGIKRRVWALKDIEYYSTLRTKNAIERSDAVIFLIDANLGITDRDLKVLADIIEQGKALIVSFNKWDLLDEAKKYSLEISIDQNLNFVQWAPRINFSAKTAWHTNRLGRALEESLNSYEQRIATAKINSFIKELADEHPHPVRGGKQSRILYGSQVDARPPKFIFHTTGPLENPYIRFIENRLRQAFSFYGTPIKIVIKPREKSVRRK